ncbi:MAG: glycosyltransferase family 2 protein [Clostridia bacterium]|nr:glycosyltransferase family 2 protein [Clostridia bacterium]
MIKLSVVVITFNEERNIGRCLASVQEVADEILVVDSLSTDRTVEICKKYGARVVSHPFEGFIEQKNFALREATFPHQLSLDADEALTPELINGIIEIKNNWTHHGYSMNRLANYCGQWIRHSGWYPDAKLRLYDSQRGQWGGVNPHDRFVLTPGATTAHLTGDLLHYTYYTIEEHVAQSNKFSTIAASELLARGRRATIFKILVKPIAKFIRNYIIHGGFRDGFYGFVICRMAAHETFLKYVKARHIRRSARESGSKSK